MSKLIRLSHSRIEYIINPDGSQGYSWGIFSGCHNHLRGICGGGGNEFHCWARSIAYRFPNHYPDGFNPHYYPEALDSPKYLKKPSIISVGWVGDVIGYGLEYKEQIYSTIRACPQHTFLFLTKNPECLPQFSPFPPNCYVGVTATNAKMAEEAGFWLWEVKANVKFVSFEPLLERIPVHFSDYVSDDIEGIKWVIIGAQTKPYKPPKIEWVEEIVRAADQAGVKVFLKDNLGSLLPIDRPFYKPIPLSGWDDNFSWEYRQEIPG